MFDTISNWLKEKFLTTKFITRIIKKTADKHLRMDYDFMILDEFPTDMVELNHQFQKIDNPDDVPAGITFCNHESLDAELHGCVFFNLRSIKGCLKDFGFWESIMIVRDITLHECRHADQFEFLRARGGPELIMRVADDQKNVPYLENIFEIDAYNYQFTGEKVDFERLFARFL